MFVVLILEPAVVDIAIGLAAGVMVLRDVMAGELIPVAVLLVRDPPLRTRACDVFAGLRSDIDVTSEDAVPEALESVGPTMRKGKDRLGVVALEVAVKVSAKTLGLISCPCVEKCWLGTCCVEVFFAAVAVPSFRLVW